MFEGRLLEGSEQNRKRKEGFVSNCWMNGFDEIPQGYKAMKLTKTTLTVDHGIYGTKELPANARDGLALVKLEGRGVTWRVYHVLTGCLIGAAGDRRTREAATRVMAALLELHIQWDGPVAYEQAGQNLEAVKAALNTAWRGKMIAWCRL